MSWKVFKLARIGCLGRTLLATAMIILVSAGPSLANCASFPKVPWWSNLNHESVHKYVAVKHGGDWNSYIKKWEDQYEKIKDIHERGSSIIVSKDKVRITGDALESYLDKVRQRLEIDRCLAAEHMAGRHAVDKASESSKSSVSSISVMSGMNSDAAVGKQKAHDAGCVKCHGTDGASVHPGVPNLAGQNDLYIVKQLMEFHKPRAKPGEPLGAVERHNRMMDNRAAALSEPDMWNLAAFFSGLSCTSDSHNEVAISRPVQAIPCIECHGGGGKSVFPEVPNLAGQKKLYLAKQLKAFRHSAVADTRGTMKDERYNYLMAAEAKDLSDSDIDDLAGYFSSQACN